jgi:hypothetical protein
MLTIIPDLLDRFMDLVVRQGAFSGAERERAGGQLAARTQADVAKGARIDHRTPWLMTVSGKGGWVPGEAFAARRRFRNITLLDHLLSVARGAGVFAELDLRAAGTPEAAVPARVAVVMAVGFLHDADKILGLPRLADLTAGQIAELMDRYRIAEFLEGEGATVAPGDMLSLIHEVEVSRAGMLMPGGRLLTRTEAADCLYVRLADRLDGAFLDSERGIRGVVEELARFTGFRAAALSSGWRAIRIEAPHTPFLLDQLQRGYSSAVRDLSGMPPLIETHHDGELLVICREEVAEEATHRAIRMATGRLGLEMRVMVNTRGTRNILDGQGGAADLFAILRDQPQEAAKALFIHRRFLQPGSAVRAGMDETFSRFGAAPNFGGIGRFKGEHYQPWPLREAQDSGLGALRADAGALAFGLGCEEPGDRRLAVRVPDANAREAELTDCLGRHRVEVPVDRRAIRTPFRG